MLTFTEQIENMKLTHKDLLFDLCVFFNNCADCNYIDECSQGKALSDIIRMLEASRITNKSFRIPGSYDASTNRRLIDLADSHSYWIAFIEAVETGDTFIQFELN